MYTNRTTLGFVVMRAQGFHAGHRDLIRKAKRQCDKLLILLGSVNLAQTITNPFTYFQRRNEIMQFLKHEYDENIIQKEFEIIPVNTYVYSDSQWLADVQEIVEERSILGRFNDVTMFGHFKPGNDYLKWFPNYKSVNFEATDSHTGTQLREWWFKHEPHHYTEDVLADYAYFEKEKETFKNYPYPETLNFVCGDAIVECAGHILLIKRRRAPGRNNWALPGGFKENNETTFETVLRELTEETNLRVPEKVLRGSVVGKEWFDDPNRGHGIPRMTLAVHFRVALNPDGSFPRVSPRDDALEAVWMPLSDCLNRISMHDDHAGIISVMTKTMPIPAHKNPRYFEGV